MKFKIEIEDSDIEKIVKVVSDQNHHSIVQDRITRNLQTVHSLITKEDFWRSLMMCLLTTQQKSSEGSSVVRFLNLNPNPLSLKNCSTTLKLSEYALNQLTSAGGIRRTKSIASEIEFNYKYLKNTNWKILDQINSLQNQDDRILERKIADNVQNSLKGIGPKQSRNLLQDLGLTKYETPIDSRIIKWLLLDLKFPIPLSAQALQDNSYYNYISGIIFELCKKADIKPCVLDAAIFSSFEK